MKSMKCKKCGISLNGYQSFCANCGTIIEKKVINKKKSLGLILLILGVVLIAGGIIFDKTSNTLVSNTSWLGKDNSQVVFTKNRIDWYKSADDHKDNYYSGEYKFYTGEDAIKYISEDLKQYGVTREEMEQLLSNNEKYNKNNFVVFDIRYDKYLLNGKEQKITTPLVPWYGFIMEDNTVLHVVNMNNIAYYTFTKQ